MKKALTKTVVDNAPTTGKEYVIWDTKLTGFGVKITKRGSKSFIYGYRMGGRGFKSRRVTIGKTNAGLTVDMARREAEKHAIKVKQGVDPQEEKKASRDDALSLAFDSYAEEFISRYLPKHWPKWQDEGARLLRREAIPHFGHRPLPSIQKRDVTALFDKLADRTGIARNTSTVLRKLFKWAVSRGELDTSPMEGIKLPEKTAVRNRYLDDTEIAALWRATLTIDHPYAAVVRTLLITGQRRDEVAEMVWGEIDTKNALWTLPGGLRTKNSKVHVVPLTPLALQQLPTSPFDECPFVFSASGSKPIQNWSYWKTRLDKAFKSEMTAAGELPPEGWKLHDLRRTVATGMQRLGVIHDVVEAFQNRETREGVAGRYQHHDYQAEKRAAANLWSDHVQVLVT